MSDFIKSALLEAQKHLDELHPEVKRSLLDYARETTYSNAMLKERGQDAPESND